MERFHNILFASLGGKEDLVALDRANRLAVTNRARITLVRAIEELPMAASYFLPKKRLQEFHDAAISVAQNEIDGLAKTIDPSIQVETRVLLGKPFIELVRKVLADSHDLLIKAKGPASKGKTLGGMDLHLLRKCPCPFWIIKPNQRKPFGKILIAVDPDPSDPDRLEMHADLVKLGSSLAKRENGKVEAVHVWTLDGESILRGPRFRMNDDEIRLLADEVQSTRQKWLENLVAPFGDGDFKLTLVKGQSGPTLVELIEKRKPDVVVMGTLARSGLPGLLIGNTAEFVLGQISCSILTIKPKGFRTPIS